MKKITKLNGLEGLVMIILKLEKQQLV